MPPPSTVAELLLNEQLVRVGLQNSMLNIAPPPEAELPVKTQLIRVASLPPGGAKPTPLIPPPALRAKFPVNVQPVRTGKLSQLHIAPPSWPDALPMNIQSVSVGLDSPSPCP